MKDDRNRTTTDETGAPRGLGRVVYGDQTAEPTRAECKEDAKVVNEASEESFPASDPPNYTVGNPNRATSPDETT